MPVVQPVLETVTIYIYTEREMVIVAKISANR